MCFSNLSHLVFFPKNLIEIELNYLKIICDFDKFWSYVIIMLYNDGFFYTNFIIWGGGNSWKSGGKFPEKWSWGADYN